MKLTKNLENKIKTALYEADNTKYCTPEEKAEIVHTIWSLNLLENKKIHKLSNRRYQDIPDYEKEQFENIVVRLSSEAEKPVNPEQPIPEIPPPESLISSTPTPTATPTASATPTTPTVSTTPPQKTAPKVPTPQPIFKSGVTYGVVKNVPETHKKLGRLLKHFQQNLVIHSNGDSEYLKSKSGLPQTTGFKPLVSTKDNKASLYEDPDGGLHIIGSKDTPLTREHVAEMLTKAQGHLLQRKYKNIATGLNYKGVQQAVTEHMKTLNKKYKLNLEHDTASHVELQKKIGANLLKAMQTKSFDSPETENHMLKVIKDTIHEDYLDGLFKEHGLNSDKSYIVLPLKKSIPGQKDTKQNFRIPLSLFKHVLLNGEVPGVKYSKGNKKANVRISDDQRKGVDKLLRKNRPDSEKWKEFGGDLADIGKSIPGEFARIPGEFADEVGNYIADNTIKAAKYIGDTKEKVGNYLLDNTKNIREKLSNWEKVLRTKGSSLNEVFTRILGHIVERKKRVQRNINK